VLFQFVIDFAPAIVPLLLVGMTELACDVGICAGLEPAIRKRMAAFCLGDA
jgi:hypothetical protein